MKQEQKIIIALSHEELKKHWKSIMVEGTLFLLLGALAFIMPLAFSLAFDIVLGWFFLLGGGIQLYRSIQSNQAPGFWIMVTSALFMLIFGVVMVFQPLHSLVALTFIIATYFMLEGILKIAYSIQIKPFATHAGVLISGLCSLIIAGIAFSGWPSSSSWLIGILLSAYLMINGIGLMMISYQIHHEDD